MKATINHTALSKELKKMSLLIKKNNIIPITSSVLFSFDKNKLTITGTDLETTYVSVIDCECKESFKVVIEYTDISDVCSSAVSPIQLEVKKSQLLITHSKAKLSFTVSSEPEHFPLVPEDSFDLTVNVDGDFFYNLSNANECKYPDEAKANLNMAAIDFKKNSVVVVGCDANILFKKELETKCNGNKVVMIPDSFVQSCKGFQESTVSVGEKYIKAECGNDTVVSVLSTQTYAAYNSIIPTDIEYNVTFDKAELQSCLRSISIAANLISKQVVIEFTDGLIKFTSQDIDFGKGGESEIPTDHKVELDKICLNLKWLTHLLNLINGEEIEMAFKAPDKTVYLRPLNDNTELCLLQPLLIN